MSSASQIAQPAEVLTSSTPALPVVKRGGRIIALDALRGFLLVWMTLTHLPTKASVISNQTFGFVSGAEGFTFLAAFMVGQIEYRVEQRSGIFATYRDAARRTLRMYVYHCALLGIAFSLVAEIGVKFHRLALENLLSFYLDRPHSAMIAGALLQYRPSLLDILPMYIVFMLFTPIVRAIARRWGWAFVVCLSLSVWIAAQFGLRAWIYRHVDLFGLHVPETSTGAFDSYAWQFLWIAGLALGSVYASGTKSRIAFPGWLLKLSIVVAAVFLVLRYSPVDHWINPSLYGWLIDKWHLGCARIIDFSAITIVLVRFGAPIGNHRLLTPLVTLGRASIEVFCVHVLCCVAGNALSPDADPILPWTQQAVLLTLTFCALYATARLRQKRPKGALLAPPQT